MTAERDANAAPAPLPAVSVVEACLYVWVSPCSICARGREAIDVGERGGQLRMLGSCEHCGTTDEFIFALPPVSMAEDPISSAIAINATDTPSRLVDVGQWLTLHQMLIERADADPMATERRWLRIRAGECLDEAMRFYDDFDERPAGDAFWHERSKQAFRDDPDRFTRSRLRALRERLPVASVRETERSRGRERKWWQFWRVTGE